MTSSALSISSGVPGAEVTRQGKGRLKLSCCGKELSFFKKLMFVYFGIIRNLSTIN